MNFNPFMTGNTNDTINNALGIYNSVKNASNPMGALQALASTNPQVAKAMEIVNQTGGDAKAAFMKLAEQYGINPNSIMNLMK